MYWAGMFGEREMVCLFLKGIGLSPFSKLFRGCSVVTACVQGHQIELLECLCANSKLFKDEDSYSYGDENLK